MEAKKAEKFFFLSLTEQKEFELVKFLILTAKFISIW